MATNSNKQNNNENNLDTRGKQNNININDNQNLDKNNKGSAIFSLMTVLLILMFAAVSVISYLPIRNSYFPVEDNVTSYIESRDFSYSLSRLTRDLQQSINQSDERYYARYSNVESVKYKVNGTVNPDLDSGSEVEEQVNEEEINRESDIDKAEGTEEGTEENTEITDSEQGIEITTEVLEGTENGEAHETAVTVEQRSLSNLANISDSQLDKEIEDSLFYMRAVFDENGNPQIETSMDKKLVEEQFISHLTYSTPDNNLEEFANLDLLYIVPQNFEEYNDAFTSDMKNSHIFQGYSILILAIGAVSILILIIVAFAVPYSKQRKTAISRVYNKMFLELKFFTWLLFIALFPVAAEIIRNTYGHYAYGIGNFIYDVNPDFYIIGIILTFILYLLVYLNIVYIKYIYYKGIKEGLINNSFFGKLLLYTATNSKEVFKRLTSINFKEDNYGKLVALAGVNLLAIWILGSTGFLGFVLSLAYTVFIFKQLLKIYDKAKELNEASSKVAEGDFNIKLNEDMGILSPMAENLNNIKQGFSLAVEKETKSQRMKSELISNVSHDLKTPLTSIISYVDLLKKEELDEETQKEYIEVLDKKSQRLKVLIEDLFEASKATSGNVDLKLENIDIVALFKQTLGELEEKINKSKLDFKIDTPENKVICNLDGHRIYRVFENIISNILKYSMENSRVYIDVKEDDAEVSFIFKNISAYEMNFDASEITERFTRGDESRNTEGSGLGLSIAKSFVELQNGNLDIIIDGDLFKLIVTFPRVE